jgi:hypothetical protein
MKKIKLAIMVVLLAMSVGVSYAIVTMRDMPDIFDWENEDD